MSARGITDEIMTAEVEQVLESMEVFLRTSLDSEAAERASRLRTLTQLERRMAAARRRARVH